MKEATATKKDFAWAKPDMQKVWTEGSKLKLDTLQELQRQKKSGTALTPWPLDRFVKITLLTRDLTDLTSSQVQKLMADGLTVADVCHLPELQTSDQTEAAAAA